MNAATLINIIARNSWVFDGFDRGQFSGLLIIFDPNIN